MIRVKICGITNLEDALAAESLGADALGFIFTPKSPRCIKLALAKKITSSLGPFLLKAGVFMDQKKEEVLKVANYLSLDIIQFHGSESFTYCNYFKPQFKVIKVCFPHNSLKDIERYQKLDGLMFDIPYHQKEDKKTLPKSTLNLVRQQIQAGRKIIISAGLNCNNLEKVINLNPYGVDVSSGVEKLVGKKDKKLIREFIRRLKSGCF